MKSSVSSLSMMILVVGILLVTFNCVQAQDVDLTKPQPKITIVSAVRVRRGPQTLAQEITRLKLGTVISAVARSSETSELLGKKDYWYRVSLPDDGPGWIFGGLLTDHAAERRHEIGRRIIEER